MLKKWRCCNILALVQQYCTSHRAVPCMLHERYFAMSRQYIAGMATVHWLCAMPSDEHIATDHRQYIWLVQQN